VSLLNHITRLVTLLHISDLNCFPTVFSDATLDGKKLQFTLKEPFEAVIALSKTGKWYHLPDVLRTECYQAIIRISKELRIAKEYLGNGLPELGLATT
jgi:hypothetical protein